MSQANDSPSTERVSFQSAGAIPRHRAATALPLVTEAHHRLIETLATEAPSPIVGYAADRFDLLGRAGHLKAVLDALTVYTKAIVADTVHFSRS
jgi:hypothetical protein